MTNTDNERDEGHNASAESPQQPNILSRLWKKFITGKGAMWTAIFTAALVFFTGKLYQVSDRQNTINISSQRGFLTFFGPSPGARKVDTAGAWTGDEIALTWVNSGNTAARNVVIQNNASPFFPDLPQGYSFPLAQPKVRVVIGPKATYGSIF
jgi:hypothetical protein